MQRPLECMLGLYLVVPECLLRNLNILLRLRVHETCNIAMGESVDKKECVRETKNHRSASWFPFHHTRVPQTTWLWSRCIEFRSTAIKVFLLDAPLLQLA